MEEEKSDFHTTIIRFFGRVYEFQLERKLNLPLCTKSQRKTARLTHGPPCHMNPKNVYDRGGLDWPGLGSLLWTR